MVTLKGPVRSDQEKQTVEAKAVAVAGAGHRHEPDERRAGTTREEMK